jgi:hypothetical protein
MSMETVADDAKPCSHPFLPTAKRFSSIAYDVPLTPSVWCPANPEYGSFSSFRSFAPFRWRG